MSKASRFELAPNFIRTVNPGHSDRGQGFAQTHRDIAGATAEIDNMALTKGWVRLPKTAHAVPVDPCEIRARAGQGLRGIAHELRLGDSGHHNQGARVSSLRA